MISASPITEEPKKEKEESGNRGRVKPVDYSINGGSEIEESSKLRGLSSLAVANVIQIKVDKKWWRCDWSVRYKISDDETDTVIFTAVEKYSLFNFCNGSLQTVLVRDLGKTPIARICYKEKYCSNKLVMAVYAPPDLLVGTVEESTGFLGSTEFTIRNSDGNPIFCVEYKHGTCPVGSLCCCCGWKTCICGSYFKVKFYESKVEVGKFWKKQMKDFVFNLRQN